MTPLLERYFARLELRQPWRWRGQVLESVGQTIESTGPPVSVGECCQIQDHAGCAHAAEVIGFRGSNVLSMPVEAADGVRFGDPVWSEGVMPRIEVGPALMGRVLDAEGIPIDDGREPSIAKSLPLDGAVRSPFGHGHSRHRCAVDRGPRAEGRHLWRVGRREEHAGGHDDAQHRG